MVGRPILNLSRNGLTDWLIQRVSAIFIGSYALYLLFFFMSHPELQFEQWHGLFHSVCFGVATIVALLFVLAHAWIGLWTVLTDYVKPVFLSLLLQVGLVLLLLFYLVWGLMIIWV